MRTLDSSEAFAYTPDWIRLHPLRPQAGARLPAWSVTGALCAVGVAVGTLVGVVVTLMARGALGAGLGAAVLVLTVAGAGALAVQLVRIGRRLHAQQEHERARATRLHDLLECVRELSLQTSETGAYERLQRHAQALVAHDRFELAIFDTSARYAGRFSATGLIDASTSMVREDETLAVRRRVPLLGFPDGRLLDALQSPEAPLREVRALHLPVISGRHVVAVMTIERERPGFTAEELDTLAALGHYGGVAIGRARLLLQVLRAKREWERAFDATSEGIALVAPDGSFRRMNVSLATICELPVTQVVGRHHHDLLPPLDDGSGPCILCETLRTGAHGDYVLEDASGRVLRVTTAPDSPGGAVMVMTDITMQRRAEEGIRAAQQRLHEAEKLAAIGRLAGGVSHNVNNPLMGITGLATVLLQDGSLDADTMQLVELIRAEARKATKITRDMLQFVRGDLTVREPVDLNESVREVAKLRADAQAARGIALELALCEEGAPIVGHRAQILQALFTLVVQAESAVAAADRKRLRITTCCHDGHVELQVEDSGPGIPESELGRIFEPFFRTHGPEDETDLGLSIAYAIVERHGGRLRAENVAGAGTRFCMELPAAADVPVSLRWAISGG